MIEQATSIYRNARTPPALDGRGRRHRRAMQRAGHAQRRAHVKLAERLILCRMGISLRVRAIRSRSAAGPRGRLWSACRCGTHPRVPVAVAASLSTSLLRLSSWLPSSRTTAFVAGNRGVGDVALAVGAGAASPSPGRRPHSRSASQVRARTARPSGSQLASTPDRRRGSRPARTAFAPPPADRSGVPAARRRSITRRPSARIASASSCVKRPTCSASTSSSQSFQRQVPSGSIQMSSI